MNIHMKTMLFIPVLLTSVVCALGSPGAQISPITTPDAGTHKSDMATETNSARQQIRQTALRVWSKGTEMLETNAPPNMADFKQLIDVRDSCIAEADPYSKVLGLAVQDLIDRVLVTWVLRASDQGGYRTNFQEWHRIMQASQFGPAQLRQVYATLNTGLASRVHGQLAGETNFTGGRVYEMLEKQSSEDAVTRIEWEHWKKYTGRLATTEDLGASKESVANYALAQSLFIARQSWERNLFLRAATSHDPRSRKDISKGISELMPANSRRMDGSLDNPDYLSLMVRSLEVRESKSEIRDFVREAVRPFLASADVPEDYAKIAEETGFGIGFFLPPEQLVKTHICFLFSKGKVKGSVKSNVVLTPCDPVA